MPSPRKLSDKERRDVARRLLAMQASLDQSLEWITTVADAAASGDAHGLAFSSLMLKEALEVWRQSMTAYIEEYLG